MRNIHERVIAAPAATMGSLFDDLSSDRDRLWPAPVWPRMRFDGPLAVGADGGHGDVRYVVSAYEPGRRVEFGFHPAIGLTGYHALEVDPVDGDTCVVRHVLQCAPHGRMRLLLPLAVRWLHDALIGDLLDNAERAATGRVASPYRHSPWVRLLLRLEQPRARTVPFPADSRVADSLPRVDYADAYQIRVPAGVGADAEGWFAAGFTPPWDMALRGPGEVETVGGGETRHFDYRAAILVDADERRLAVTIASVVQFHDRLGRFYFAAIRPGHVLAARAVLRRAARRMVAAAPSAATMHHMVE